jgi:hypothetical protein
MGAGNNTMVYQVSGLLLFFINIEIQNKKMDYSIENMPIEAILEQLGINSNTLQPSNNLSNYYRSNLLVIKKFFDQYFCVIY